MSDPKVPSWLASSGPYATPTSWFSRISEYVAYEEGSVKVRLDGDFTAQQLRELADLIDSCQEGETNG